MPKRKKGISVLSIIKFSILSIIIFICFIFIGGIFVLLGVSSEMPQAVAPQPALTSYLLDSKGETFAQLHAGENRDPIKLSDVPLQMQYATIAVEDARFYEHIGIDVKGIVRAVVVDITTMSKKEGASTITQQLAKNAFLNQEKTWTRKIKEMLLAVQLERHYSKEQILEFYLNQIYYGNGASGIKMAARTFFGKNVSDLSLAECALLAGLPKSPTYYSPYTHLEEANERKNLVLNRMLEQGYITENQAEEAKNEKLVIKSAQKGSNNLAPYFVDYILQELEAIGFTEKEIFTGGLHVYTTLDQTMQMNAEKTIADNILSGPLKGKADKNGLIQPQLALVTIQPKDGYIRAMVGGRDYSKSKFNRSVQAYRQPGSSFKPFVYTTALDSGMTPGTMIEDKAYRYGGWSPRNYGGDYKGPVTIAYALEKSINTVAVQTMHMVGADKVIDTAEKMGISSMVREGNVNDLQLASALGGVTKGISPLEMTAAYSVFANNGLYVKPTGIIKVEDKNGNVVYENKTIQKEAIPSTTAYLMSSMMKNVISRGTGARANIGRPAAGKTGTTSDYTDAWFVGFTPDLATAIWIGSDNAVEGKSYMRSNQISSSFAAGIWGKYMKKAVAGIPSRDFVRPDGIVGPISISKLSGLLPSPACSPDEIIGVYFLKGTVPTETCNLHGLDGEIILPDGTIIPADSNGGIPDDVNQLINEDNNNSPDNKPTEPKQDDTSEKYIYVLIDSETGYLATERCPHTELKRFKVGEQPDMYCPVH